MKRIAVGVLVCQILISTIGFSQNDMNTSQGVKEILELGSDSIVEMALSMMDEKASLDSFTKTSIQSNGEEVIVVFSNPIIYLPLNSVYCSDVIVNISTNAIYSNTVANPMDFESQQNVPYYQQNEQSKKNLEFVLNAIGDIDSSDVGDFQGTMLIREKVGFYQVSVVSKNQESWYKVQEGSGKIYDEGHAHLEAEPNLEQNNLEFKKVSFSE